MQNIMPIKQFFTVALALAVVVMFAGCSDSQSGNSPSNTAVANGQAPAEASPDVSTSGPVIRGGSGVLEFRIAPRVGGGGNFLLPGGEAEAQRLRAQFVREGPDAGRERNDPWLWFPAKGQNEKLEGLITQFYEGKVYVLLANSDGNAMLNPPAAREWGLDDARVGIDYGGRFAVEFTFDPPGSQRFATLTRTHKGNFLAILVDNEVYGVPRINDVISKGGMISGDFTEGEAEELARKLR